MADTTLTAPADRPGALGMLRATFRELTPVERRRTVAMYGTIAALHVAGFAVFLAFVVPLHVKNFGFGIAVLAYTLGLRHAFDADHISAIDNTTRKALQDRQGTGRPRPLGYGFFFSLGHSSIVAAMGVALVVAERSVLGAVTNPHSAIHQFGGLFGTSVSAVFLFLIGGLNLVVLLGILKVFRSMRRGEYDEAQLEHQLDQRGFMYRFFGRWMRAIDKEWQIYPVGVLFGLGFDTATEVLLLSTTAVAAASGLPWYGILCLPVLFTAGMALADTTDCLFMNVAYGWAFFNPVRKVYYNLAITALSVAICFFIGAIEALGLIATEVPGLDRGHGFWKVVSGFNINMAGFVIVGLFVVTWAGAVLVWRWGRIEERWSARLQGPGALGVD